MQLEFWLHEPYAERGKMNTFFFAASVKEAKELKAEALKKGAKMYLNNGQDWNLDGLPIWTDVKEL